MAIPADMKLEGLLLPGENVNGENLWTITSQSGPCRRTIGSLSRLKTESRRI